MYKLSYINDNRLSLPAREKVWFSCRCKLPKVYQHVDLSIPALMDLGPVVDQGGEGAMAPWPCKISHKKMAAKGGCIDFMFLTPITWSLDPLLRAYSFECLMSSCSLLMVLHSLVVTLEVL